MITARAQQTEQASNAGASPRLPAPDWLERGLIWLDSAGRIEGIDQSFLRWLNRSEADLRGEHIGSVLAGICREAEGALTLLLQEPGPFAEVTLNRGESGLLRIEGARNTAGWILRCQSILPPRRDLAESGWSERLSGDPERRELFGRLLKAETQLENVSRGFPGVIFTQRPDFSFQFVSPQIEALTGISPEGWARSAADFWQVVHEADAEELQRHIRRVAETGERLALHYRLRHFHTGRTTYVLEHRQAVRGASGPVLSYEGVWLDITRQTIAERRLSAAAWKETLAMLTIGLAHDFNNILAGITSLSESFLAQCREDHPFAEGLELIRSNALQASQLVHRMTSLHRSKTGERNYHNVNEAVAEFVDLAKKILPRRIQVAEYPAAVPLPVFADAVELRQVVLNLALNAADAMPDRGQLTFRALAQNHWTLPAHFVGVAPRMPAVCLEVEDTGCGIPDRHLPLLFDPFFTTKPVNKGSGLGLYNARLFAETHHGGISVESAEGRGTTFRLWLPRADFSEAERAEAAGPRRSVLLHGEPGLLLDSTTEFLRTSGYYVVQASAPDKARDLLVAEDNRFAALMVLADPRDAALPGFIREVNRRFPQVKIVLQPAGGTADEFDAGLMAMGHLTVTNEMCEADIVKHLDTLLRDTPAS